MVLIDSLGLFPRVPMSNTRGSRFKIGGEMVLKEIWVCFFFATGGISRYIINI